MAQKSSESTEFKVFTKALSDGAPATLYIFYGEEHYLIDRYLEKLRSLLIQDGLDEFNHRRFEGRGLDAAAISNAVDMLPVFAERTLIEIRDLDIFKMPEAERRSLIKLFSDLPDYVCLVFIYDTIEFKPDKRLKDTKEILKLCHAVEFAIQDGRRISNWICRHIKDGGKSISQSDAEYLSFITGGQMTSLNTEINKLCSFSTGDVVTRGDIDACVIPVPDAVTYKMTDAIVKGRYNEAAEILSELFRMREPAQKIIYSISASMRQLLFARICLEAGKGAGFLMESFGIRYDFQAKNLMTNAKSTTLEKCRSTVLLCAQAALSINSGFSPEETLSELVASICLGRKAVMVC